MSSTTTDPGGGPGAARGAWTEPVIGVAWPSAAVEDSRLAARRWAPLPGKDAAVDGSQREAGANRHKRLPGDTVSEAWVAVREVQARPACDLSFPGGDAHFGDPTFRKPTIPATPPSTMMMCCMPEPSPLATAPTWSSRRLHDGAAVR